MIGWLRGKWPSSRPPLTPEARDRLAREAAAVEERQRREHENTLAADARRLREEEEARVEAERREAADRAFVERVRGVGVYFPGDGYTSAPSRLSGRPSWGARVLGRIFGAGS
ncbi:MAG: hypothetical protein HY729_05115 [Candidatus Rokubacteria bacterium]|nr:hypothetical protein [Candidatus Rokubacteria bacterium]